MLNVYTPFVAPQLIAQGGQSLGAGIAGAGQSISNLFDRIAAKKERDLDEFKRLAGNAKAADIAFKNNPDLFGGIAPEQWSTLSARDKVGAFAGAVTSATLAQHQAQVDRMKQDAEAARQFARFASQYAAGPPLALAPSTLDQFSGAGGERTPIGDFNYALSQHPAAVNSPQFDNFTRAVAGLAEVPAAGPTAPPAVEKLPGGYYSYGFAGTKQRGVYPDLTVAPQQFGEGMYVTSKGQNLFQPRQEKPIVPESFNRTLDDATEKIHLAQESLLDPNLRPETKARAQATLAAQRKRAIEIINRYHTTGFLTDEQRDEFLNQYGEGTSRAPSGGPKEFNYLGPGRLQEVK